MAWFWNKDDKLSEFKSAVMAAVRTGDAGALEAAFTGSIDAPADILTNALEKTIDNNQTRLTSILLAHGASASAVSSSTLHDIVARNRKDMFRILIENGVNFFVHAPQNNEYSRKDLYISSVNGMLKDVECDRLKAEIALLKQELTVRGWTEPEPATPAFRKDMAL